MEPPSCAAAWGARRDAASPTRTDALDAALERSATSGGPLMVCGSLYLVGYVRGRLMADGAIE